MDGSLAGPQIVLHVGFHLLLEQEAQQVLGIVSHAQHVFGGDVPPAEPPAFAPRCDLEGDLGRGYFRTRAASGSRGAAQRYVRSVGDNEHADNGDDLANDVADPLILEGAWTWAVGGSGTQR
jgi:hypothetical protein